MCSSKPKTKTPAQAPPPGSSAVTDPARLLIARNGANTGVRGLVINRKT